MLFERLGDIIFDYSSLINHYDSISLLSKVDGIGDKNYSFTSFVQMFFERVIKNIFTYIRIQGTQTIID